MLLFFNFIACLASLILTNSQNDKMSLPYVFLQYLSRCPSLRNPCWQICSLRVFHLLFLVFPVNTRFQTSVRPLKFLSSIKMAVEIPIKKKRNCKYICMFVYYLYMCKHLSIILHYINKYSERENFISIMNYKLELAKLLLS